jgi:hypothetical protein
MKAKFIKSLIPGLNNFHLDSVALHQMRPSLRATERAVADDSGLHGQHVSH